MISLSIVDSVTDRHPEVFTAINWPDFVTLMEEQSRIEAAPTAARKKQTKCVSPAIYPDGVTRSKEAALGWNWFSADIDNKEGNRIGATIDDIIDVMRPLDSPFIIYTTTSHKPEAQCFRLMFPLDRMIKAAEFNSVWRSFAAKFRCFDEQTKDICRLFILPRAWEGRANRFECRTNGVPVCVDDIVQAYPATVDAKPDPVPRLNVVTPRQYGRSNDLCDLDNSPIIPSCAVEEAMSVQTGGRMYRFLCSVACSAHRKGYV